MTEPATSTKPYFLRALYEWCTDNGFTPYIAVMVDANTRVPMEFVKNGEIVLNISFDATGHLKIDNDIIHFKARFGGVSREIVVPVENVSAIYARENGQGMAFEVVRDKEVIEPKGKKKTAIKSVEVSSQRPGLVAGLSAVPASDAPAGKVVSTNEDPEPPKKGGPPRLTRIK